MWSVVELGEEKPRTVCSGLVAHISLQDMQVSVKTNVILSPLYHFRIEWLYFYVT